MIHHHPSFVAGGGGGGSLAASAALLLAAFAFLLRLDFAAAQPAACDLCSGRGGSETVSSLDRDLTFIPAFGGTGSVKSCVDLLDQSSSQSDGSNVCSAFQSLGVYCGCNPASVGGATNGVCGMCFEGRQLTDETRNFKITGTALEEGLLDYSPTCGWYENEYLPGFADGSDECEEALEASQGQCTCVVVPQETEPKDTTGPTTTTTEPMVGGTSSTSSSTSTASSSAANVDTDATTEAPEGVEETETTAATAATDPPEDTAEETTKEPVDEEPVDITEEGTTGTTAAATVTIVTKPAEEEAETETTATEEPPFSEEEPKDEPEEPVEEPKEEPDEPVEPQFVCDLCAGRGGNDKVKSLAKDLTFLPGIAQFGAMLGAESCDKFTGSGIDTLMELLADDNVAINLLQMSAAMPKEDSCAAFQFLGVYCGCEEEDPPCRICGGSDGGGEEKLVNSEEYLPGTIIETLVMYKPTCGFYDDVFLPNVKEGTDECEEYKGIATEGGCRCSTEEPTASPTPRPTVGEEGIIRSSSDAPPSLMMAAGTFAGTVFATLLLVLI